MCDDPDTAAKMAQCQGGDVDACQQLSQIAGYNFSWDLGSVYDLGSPEKVMAYFKSHASSVFPFALGEC
jgi:hypothetical protein